MTLSRSHAFRSRYAEPRQQSRDKWQPEYTFFVALAVFGASFFAVWYS